MKCPVCKDVDLVMSERSGIEIDYCPKCRGVWLDRGELDKIIERSTEVMPQQQQSRQYEGISSSVLYEPDYAGGYNTKKYYYDDDYRYEHHHSKYKKRNFLSDIFDFD